MKTPISKNCILQYIFQVFILYKQYFEKDYPTYVENHVWIHSGIPSVYFQTLEGIIGKLNWDLKNRLLRLWELCKYKRFKVYESYIFYQEQTVHFYVLSKNVKNKRWKMDLLSFCCWWMGTIHMIALWFTKSLINL